MHAAPGGSRPIRLFSGGRRGPCHPSPDRLFLPPVRIPPLLSTMAALPPLSCAHCPSLAGQPLPLTWSFPACHCSGLTSPASCCDPAPKLRPAPLTVLVPAGEPCTFPTHPPLSFPGAEFFSIPFVSCSWSPGRLVSSGFPPQLSQQQPQPLLKS